jgi:hypothetical protein
MQKSTNDLLNLRILKINFDCFFYQQALRKN